MARDLFQRHAHAHADPERIKARCCLHTRQSNTTSVHAQTTEP